MTATNTDTSKRPLIERPYSKPRPPMVPHTAHQRELLMPDGRRLLVDRRAIAFLAEGKPDEFGTKPVCIVGFKSQAKACPVTTPYDELATWWRAEAPETNGKAA
jgi:hypothetical protein